MSKLYKTVTELIGNTPLIELNNVGKNLPNKLIGKVEFFNPGGSVKDRIALAMISDAEAKGLLKEGSTIVEPTSGNTGIGLAMVGASKGYKVILTMPETMSVERRNLLKAFGAKLVLTEGSKGMKGAIAKAIEIANEIPHSFIPSQFENQANPQIHFKTTGPEIYEALNGKVDYLISGIGTGGTISGAGEYLKKMIPGVKVIAVEPTDSPVLSKGVVGPHKIQGIGAGFVPDTLNTKIYDEIITVTNDEAYAGARRLAREEGLLVGISSGAAFHAALVVASRQENVNKNIVIIFPDTGERYLSTTLFTEE